MSSRYRRDCRFVTLRARPEMFHVKTSPDGSDTNIRLRGPQIPTVTCAKSGNSRGTVRALPLRSSHDDSGSSLNVTDILTDKNKSSHSCLGEKGHHPPLCMPVKRSFSTVSS